MKKVLVDTSVWIDALNGRKTEQTKLFERLLEQDAPLVTCPVIVQEILQGIKDDGHFQQVKESLSGFELLKIDALEAAYGAASLYRSIRKRGATIRKSNDCLIAFYAIFHNIVLLHNDEDFNRITQYTTLDIFKER